MPNQETTDLCISRETVNDDTVTLLEWLAADGAQVSSGEIVATVETSKSVLDLESPTDGILRHGVSANSEVEIGAVVGQIVAEGASEIAPVSEAIPVTSVSSDKQMVSAGAQQLIDQHQLGIDPFSNLAMVRKRDVLAFLKDQNQVETSQESLAESPSDETSSGTTLVANPVPVAKRGGLLADARKSASERGGKSIVWMACNYLYRNWFLGLLARVSPRGVILFVHRRRGVKMGHSCYIDPTATLETAYPENITMGNDVRIAAGVAIMTHIKAPHYHREHGLMPVVIKPVVLDDHVFVGVNAVILPGVHVGKAAVIASGAVVSEHVPDHTMVAGSPARVIKRFTVPDSDPS